jgi:phosphomevalonate kinase
VVSAPGKVLVAGGYLVLDPAFSGTVISTSSRFYTVIREQSPPVPNTIRVKALQFLEAVWIYDVVEDGSELKVEPAASKCVHLGV